jgi:hypothetical protein
MTAKKPKLTVRQATIIKRKAEGVTQNKIAEEVYPNATPESGAVLVSRELKKVNVQEALELALQRAGITPDLAIAPIGEALLHDDLDMRLKGSDRALKLMVPKSDGQNININFGTVISEMKDNYAD